MTGGVCSVVFCVESERDTQDKNREDLVFLYIGSGKLGFSLTPSLPPTLRRILSLGSASPNTFSFPFHTWSDVQNTGKRDSYIFNFFLSLCFYQFDYDAPRCVFVALDSQILESVDQYIFTSFRECTVISSNTATAPFALSPPCVTPNTWTRGLLVYSHLSPTLSLLPVS